MARNTHLFFENLYRGAYFQAAFDYAYRVSSEVAQQRYDERDITLDFLSDIDVPTGPDFVESRLEFTYDRK